MRERLSMDRQWRFALGHAANASLDFEFARDRALVKTGEGRGAASPTFDDSKWRMVDVPHDWAIELPLDPRGDKELCEHGFRSIGPDHPESSVGWYRRRFDLPASDLGKRLSIELDGVFRDSVVWVNGHRLGRHASGYTPVCYDITDVANYGGDNLITVRVDATNYEGWWYEGAGIYRHVWLVKTNPVHVARWGVFVTTHVGEDGQATLTVRTDVCNDSDQEVRMELTNRLSDGTQCATWHMLGSGEQETIIQRLLVSNPRLWSCEQPNLYSLWTAVKVGDCEVDQVQTNIGIRSLDWDADRGFLLNGQVTKIRGVCIHRDHAGVGVALPDRLHGWRVEKLKEMGANAIRLSHYPGSPELLDACDRLGMLVMAENRLASSSASCQEDLATMIRRDRNHPSVFLWSIGNEEHTIQWAVAGERIGRTLVRLAHRLDPTRRVTAAMHDRGLGEGFANIVDVHGWNYINVGDMDAFRARRPEQPIIGSEEASTVTTRGIYADDRSRGYVRAYDQRAPKWGSTAEGWMRFYDERPWLAGAFVWTGFDYRGEPIPYQWPCTVSHFGLMDLCGFPKDLYWYYKAWWGTGSVLHLLPHWNWTGREGEELDVWCYSNQDEVELFLNGKSLGRAAVPRLGHVRWPVVYEPGRLEVRGYRQGAMTQTTARETTGAAAKLTLSTDRAQIRADGEDVACVTVGVQDEDGRAVPDAMNLVRWTICGSGKLIGVGNGDPSSHESDKAPLRRLFNGLAMGLLQSTMEPGEIQVRVEAEGLAPAMLRITTIPAPADTDVDLISDLTKR